MRRFPIYGFRLVWQSPEWNYYRKQCPKYRGDRKVILDWGMCGKHRLGRGYLFECDGFCDRMYKWTDRKRKEEWELPDGDPVAKEKWMRSLGRGFEADDFIREYGNDRQKNILKDKEERLEKTAMEVIKYLNKQHKKVK